MSTATAAGRARSPFVALVVYTLRSTLPRRRWVGALLPCAAAVLFGLLSRSDQGPPVSAFTDTAGVALFGLVLPVTCLVLGDAVLGAELRSGTFAFTWLSPVPVWHIAVARWLGGAVVASVCVAVAFAASAVVAGTSELAAPVAVGGAAGAAAYVAVFVAIGSFARRAAVWSLAFVFLWERLLGAALSGIAQLSPGWEALAAFVGLGDVPESFVREGIPHGTGAVVRLAVVTTVALAVASARLRRIRLAGSSD